MVLAGELEAMLRERCCVAPMGYELKASMLRLGGVSCCCLVGK